MRIMDAVTRYKCILAVYVNSRGFGFALFEGPLAPVDWGIVEVRGEDRERQCVRRVSNLFGRYEPAALVMRNTSDRIPRRIRAVNEAFSVLAETQGIPIFAYSRAQVRTCFEHLGAPTKQYIAEVIAKHIPAFERYVPPTRKLWKSEDSRMGLFDAAALALAFFHVHGQQLSGV
jgi:hypothetical protein